MKYVIIEKSGMEVPIMFPDMIQHDSFVDINSGEKIISAGKFEIAYDRKNLKYIFSTWGKSVSLGISSHPEDADIIHHAFEFKG
jgi:hypothetical protein